MKGAWRYFERHRVSIAGTLLVHVIALLIFNWVTLEQFPQEPTLSVIVEEWDAPESEPDPIPERPQESVVEEAGVPTEPGRNIARNEAAPRMLNQAEYNRIEENLQGNRKQSIDEQIENELRQLEQSVISEQRAAGYGYTQEEAEALITSQSVPELQELPEQEAKTDAAYEGKTNITYRLEDRYDTYIYVPVYLCENGGEVTVNMAVDRRGTVVSAKVDLESTRTSDPCLHEAALRAARRSRFNQKQAAPSLQKGSMTFRFIAQ